MMTDAVLPDWDNRHAIEDEVILSLSHINETLDPLKFAHNLSGKCVDSKFGMSIGSMHGVLGDDDDLFVSEVSAVHVEPTKGVSASSFQNFGKLILNLLSERKR